MTAFHEYRGNIHMHTTASDGEGEPDDLVAAAARAGLKFIIVTDHNILLDQAGEGYRQGVLTLFDIEVNDASLTPEHSHCLTLDVGEDVTPFAPNPQGLIDAVRERGGLTFFAHPIDKPSPLIPDTYPWLHWDVEGFTGIELWNFMSEFRPFATSKPRAILVGYFPQYFTTGPYPEMLTKWDELLQQRPTVAIGGSDAHANIFNIGPIRREFLNYDYCFSAVNTHILTAKPFSGDYRHDRTLVYEALAAGRCWVAYDKLAPTEGFRFGASGDSQWTTIGRQIDGDELVRFDVSLPQRGLIKLIRAGAGVIAETSGDRLSYVADRPGAYRVEVWKKRWGKPRGWVFSNPIYVI
ncbi:MAG: CehA/McbA family metallohydrolase [Caldilineales bacterium]|nr:CehA/McbA family metallohydrolase [Caldilineales bacterium]